MVSSMKLRWSACSPFIGNGITRRSGWCARRVTSVKPHDLSDTRRMIADSVRPDPADGRAVKLRRWPVKSLGDCLEHAGRTSLSCQPAPERTQLAVPSAAQRAAERRIRLVGKRAGTRLAAGVCRGSIPTCAESSSTWRRSVVCYILNDERRAGSSPRPPARGTGWLLKSKFQARSTLTFLAVKRSVSRCCLDGSARLTD